MFVSSLFVPCLWDVSGRSEILQFPSHSAWPGCGEQGGRRGVSSNLSLRLQCTKRKQDPHWQPKEAETKLWRQLVKSAGPSTVAVSTAPVPLPHVYYLESIRTVPTLAPSQCIRVIFPKPFLSSQVFHSPFLVICWISSVCAPEPLAQPITRRHSMEQIV